MTDKHKDEKTSELELFNGFLEESDEMLDEIEENSRRLESEPSNRNAIHAIFRAVHSLKGNSSFFDFEYVQNFCHTFENFLDLMRDKKIEAGRENTHIILEGADHLKSIFNRLHASGGRDVPLTGAEQDFLGRIEELAGPITEEEKLEKLRKELLKYFDRHKEAMEEPGSPVREIFQLMNKHAEFIVEDRRKHRMNGGTVWKHGDIDVTREYTDMRGMMEDALKGVSDQNAMSVFMNAIDSLIGKHSKEGQADIAAELENLKNDFEIFYQEEIGVDDILAETVIQVLDEYAKNLKEIKPEAEKPAAVAEEGASVEQGPEAGRRTSFVRVEEALLDVFIDHVGELITLSELFNYLQHRLESGELGGLALNFKNTNQTFRELSHQLQRSLYEIRKVPIEGALGKLPRLVRNIARETNKKIRINASGGETEIDKSLLEKIETVLVHLVRNSAGHGIESQERRAAAGKDAEGTINIKVTSDKLDLSITVSDDGAGVNLDRVRKVAVERGLLGEEAAARLGDREVVDLILRPGFSTAETVTETSGRGVGMDVLAASVHDMGGSLSLENRPGKGLKISIKMPQTYTTRIKLGLTLAVGSSAFLIPAENVRESFKARRDDVSLVEGRGEVVQRWGSIYPVIRLSELFNIEPRYEKVWDAICVLVESRDSTMCLVVDEMIGQRQIVYKQLTVKTREPNAFEGVSILDGTRMALILSVDGIVKQFLE